MGAPAENTLEGRELDALPDAVAGQVSVDDWRAEARGHVMGSYRVHLEVAFMDLNRQRMMPSASSFEHRPPRISDATDVGLSTSQTGVFAGS